VKVDRSITSKDIISSLIKHEIVVTCSHTNIASHLGPML